MSTVGLFLIIFFVSMLFCVPIAYSLGIAVMVCAFNVNYVTTDMLIQTYFTATDSFPLLAIPFFILAGDIMLQGGLSNRLINFCSACIGNRRGSLGIITVLACMLFAAISGSGPATVAAIGGLMVPAMMKDGYSEGFSCALVACSGAMGPIIPPSILFVIYAVMVQESVTELFIAGIVPGLVMAVLLCLFTYFVARINKFGNITLSNISLRQLLSSLNEAKWALLVPIIILGGIYSGLFTPTEAAVVACVYALIVCLFVYKDITYKDLPNIFMSTAKTTGYCMAFVGSATILSRILTLEKIPDKLTQFIMELGVNKWVVLLAINLILLAVGMFMEPVSVIIILAPLLVDIIVPLGIDPVHFGIVMVLNVTIGMCTPPVGINMFIATGITGMKPEKMFKWLYPYILVLIAALFIVTYVPILTLGIPSLMML